MRISHLLTCRLLLSCQLPRFHLPLQRFTLYDTGVVAFVQQHFTFASFCGIVCPGSKNHTNRRQRSIMDKGKAIESALLQIEKKFGKGSIMRLGEKPHEEFGAISTNCLSLDAAIGVGGLPRGRIVEIYGPESSGKTTLALQVVASAQKAGGVAAYIDAE